MHLTRHHYQSIDFVGHSLIGVGGEVIANKLPKLKNLVGTNAVPY